MELVSSSPLRVASILWLPRADSFMYTVLCKATFLLRPGECPFAPEQEQLTQADELWSAGGSLRVASDLAPFKPRADVLLVGHAYAPHRAPVRSLVARLAVNELDKSIEVWCPRLVGPGGALREGAPFATAPLVYERAAGGPGTANPAGMPADTRDPQGWVELPSLQPLGASAGAYLEPVGFGPIAPTWPERWTRLGRSASEWSHVNWYSRPLPDDLEQAFFNAAPRDQQPASLRDDEAIVLENLHPEHPMLVAHLPGVRPHATVELAGAAPRLLALRADTLTIDTARVLVTMVWRGSFPVEHPRQEGRVLITLEQPAGSAGRAVGGATIVAPRAASLALEDGLPFAPSHTPHPAGPHSVAGLPFGGQHVPPTAQSARGPATTELPVFDGPEAAALPLPSVAAPPIVDAPVEPPRYEVQRPRSIGESMVSHEQEAAPLARGLREPELLAPVASVAAPPSAPAEDGGAGAAGALAASNAAAGAGATADVGPDWTPPRAAPVRALPSDVDGALLELAWFDRDTVAWMRRKAEWRPLLAELEKRPPDPAFDDPVLAREPMEIEDRREVFEILLAGAAADVAGLRAAMNEGMRPEGKFAPALVMLAGELELPFDEVEQLKALIPTASWFAGGPGPLRAAIDAGKEFLATPGHHSGAVADGYIANIRKAFKQPGRATSLEYLDGPTERLLLERRAYQKRPVFGGAHLRALFTPSGSKQPVPTYLPESAARWLPMFRRFRARVIAETSLPVDPYETHPAALRAAAVGRLVAAVRQ